MPHPIRLQYPGAWHHVFNRGAGGRDIFVDRADRVQYLGLLGELAVRHCVEVHAYCLMGNHFHLLVRTPEPELDKLMQVLSSRYTKDFNRKHGRDGPLFRGRYRSSLIETDAYLLAASRYVHRNPLGLGFRRLVRYRWSSYAAYIGRDLRPSWLVVEKTLRIAGGLNAYRSIVESPLTTTADVALDASV